MDYDTFGNVIQDTNPGFQPLGYAGGLYDAATGLIRFGARDYDPSIGRWMAKDPVGFAGASTNLYAYALNRPTYLRDPKGFEPETCSMEGMCFELEPSADTVVIFDDGAHEGIGIIMNDGSVIRFDKRCASTGDLLGFGAACVFYGDNEISRDEFPRLEVAISEDNILFPTTDIRVAESVHAWLEDQFEMQADSYYNLFNQSCQDLVDDALEQAGSDFPVGFGSIF
jgi:RHS repeat-associated protein